MTEQLIADLATIGGLRVISRTSVMQYRTARKSAPAIARELQVDAIVEGSVVRAGDTVRITTKLISGTTGAIIWAQSSSVTCTTCWPCSARWRERSPAKSMSH